MTFQRVAFVRQINLVQFLFYEAKTWNKDNKHVPYTLQSVHFLNFKQTVPDDSEKTLLLRYTFVSVNTKTQCVMYVVLHGAKISMNEDNG
jgi:hypothetical protein